MIELEKFIPPSYAEVLEEILCKNPEFTWTYTPSTNNQKETSIMKADAQSYESEQFVHAFFLEGAKRSPFFDIVFPFFYFLEEKTGIRLGAIERMKANLLLRASAPTGLTSQGVHYNTPHIDIPDAGYKSLLYYVKDSDGDTFIFNEKFHDKLDEKKGLSVRKRVSPKKGRAVVFDSNTWHASSNPRESQNRVVLNLIFKVRT
jgi:hypothetical protein